MSDAGDDRWLAAAVGLASGLLFVPLLVPLLTGTIFTLDDLSSFHLPLRHVYQSALRAGQSVVWSSQLFSGFYIHGEGQIGAFHPLHLLLYSTLPLIVAFNLELLLSYVFAFAGMCRFLRHTGFSTSSALLGAMAFTFSGFALLHLPHMNAVAVTSHVPWLLLSIDAAVSDVPGTRRRGLVGAAALFASQALLGYPQYVWMSALICTVYAVICRSARPFRIFLAGLASVAGLMIGSLQLLPSLDLLVNSVRQSVTPGFSLTYSLHPLNILQLFSPYLLLSRIYAAANERYVHEFSLYTGALATVALAWTASRRGRLPFPRFAFFGVVIVGIGLVLALGRYGLVYEWLTALPLIGKFRAPTRHIMVVHVGLSILVAILFEDIKRLGSIRSRPTRQQLWIWIPLAISAAAAATALWRPAVWQGFPGHVLSSSGMLIGGAILALMTLLVLDGARGSRAALALLPAVFAADLAVWGYSYVFSGGLATISDLEQRAEPPPAQPGTTVHRPIRNGELNTLMLHGLRILRPYVGLAPARSLSLSTDDELRAAGAEWVSTERGWRAITDPMPRARLVREWKTASSPVRLDGIDLHTTALLDQPLQTADLSGGDLTLAVDEPGRLVMDVAAAGTALIVTTEAYDPGWHARTTSGSLDTVRVYDDFLGIVVTPGAGRISATFEPDSLTKAAYTSLAGLVVLIALTAVSGRA